MLKDKNCARICDLLAPLAREIFLVPVQSERTASIADLAGALRNTHPSIPVITCGSLTAALELTQDETEILITGSLYLVGEALERLRVTADSRGAERGLNEWSATASPGARRLKKKSETCD